MNPAGLGATPPYLSSVVRAGDFLYVAGNASFADEAAVADGRAPRIGDLVEGDVKTQTRQTMQNIGLCLKAAGASLADVVKVNGYLRDVERDFYDYTDAYLEFFPGPKPARTTVEVKILGGLLVEIDCVAYKPLS